MQLKEGVQICVDDPASPDHSQIVARAEAGPEARGEEMAAIPVYERGLVVDYPTSREEKAGSCIFLHIWRGQASAPLGASRRQNPRSQACKTSPGPAKP